MTTGNVAAQLRNDIVSIPVADLAAEFGTPTYIYDASIICQRVEQLRAFDVIRFAQKACSNLAVVDLVRRQGVRVDAVSAGEIHRALQAGYQPGQDEEPPEIVFTADLFDRQSLDLVVEHDIHVNVGSPDMISQYGARAPGKSITLRINPGFGHGHSQKTNTGGEQSKHGIWYEQVSECLQRAAEYELQITGVHMHIGSGTDLEHLAQVSQAMEKTVAEVGTTVKSISAGGGLPTPYHQDDEPIDIASYFSIWDDSRQRLQQQLGHDLSLEIEPGRFLTAESGFLLTEICSIKKMGQNCFYLVDAGFNNLARPILYGSYHPMTLAPVAAVPTDCQDVVVGGPLCESGDIFTQEEGGFVSPRSLPVAQVGDYLVIECAGAYGAVMGSNYNSKPLAAEVLVQDGVAQLIRSRQSFEDLLRDEQIPG